MDRLANFEVEKRIGHGQFSEVYKAKCTVNGMTVALKKVQVRFLLVCTVQTPSPSADGLFPLNLARCQCTPRSST